MRKFTLPLMAVCALFAISAPSAIAADSTNVKQYKQIGKVRSAVKGLKAAIKVIKDIDAGQTSAVNTTQGKLDALSGTVNAILEGVPAIVNGLTALKAGLESAGAGLLQLKAGLEQAGAGLTKLGDAYQAVEYGVVGLTASNATVAAGSAATSADVPDDGNTIHVGDTAILVSQGAGAVAVDLNADIRSAESDGGAGSTVGQAGGFLWVQNLDTGVRVACGGAPNPPGIFGTTAGDSIVTPSGTVTNLPIKNLPGGRARTDTTAASTSILPAACQFAAAGAGITYGVTYSVNFLDVPTSTTPGPKE